MVTFIEASFMFFQLPDFLTLRSLKFPLSDNLCLISLIMSSTPTPIPSNYQFTFTSPLRYPSHPNFRSTIHLHWTDQDHILLDPISQTCPWNPTGRLSNKPYHELGLPARIYLGSRFHIRILHRTYRAIGCIPRLDDDMVFHYRLIGRRFAPGYRHELILVDVPEDVIVEPPPYQPLLPSPIFTYPEPNEETIRVRRRLNEDRQGNGI